ncbi:unnamed protein product [Pleuronectes platessa]|uniref:Uncharacterized protein n=1 Tax=Pleuronectes platessa TaxID=8262 RepID=A0A9N7YID3_PLEPL|nr:unnamed protein product [Pleuronectes platessa]
MFPEDCHFQCYLTSGQFKDLLGRIGALRPGVAACPRDKTYGADPVLPGQSHIQIRADSIHWENCCRLNTALSTLVTVTPRAEEGAVACNLPRKPALFLGQPSAALPAPSASFPANTRHPELRRGLWLVTYPGLLLRQISASGGGGYAMPFDVNSSFGDASHFCSGLTGVEPDLVSAYQGAVWPSG